jgi:beta-lactamase superfamily II metal-dependent hydrolase
MALGWVRAYSDEYLHFREIARASKKDKSLYRQGFSTNLHETKDENSPVLKELEWGDEVELPDGIGASAWTKVFYKGTEGFLQRKHLVEVGFVSCLKAGRKNRFIALLETGVGKIKLLWGDLVQIQKREGANCNVRARNWFGTMETERIGSQALLDVFFIDVGQGDGILVRFPEGKHLLIDGGLPRKNQMTGKNAADFLDWKFYSDYGHYKITLDGMMSSHCDSDHYGGLWDLVKDPITEDKELDCVELKIKEFFHAGLSRWKKKENVANPHKDDLGPTAGDWFVRLLGDRADAEEAVKADSENTLQGDWGSFIKAVFEQDVNTSIERLGVTEEAVRNGMEFPELWKNESACAIKVLSPITREVNGNIALKDLGVKSININGHSICLRLDYGGARILLTGDLNSASMNWISEVFGDRIHEFACDAAKACHHGSHDISYKFLKHINAAATVICSGDSEGYAHPRPEIVAVSAVTGFVEIDEEEDKLITPLIYMTEIERSVSLGRLTHIRLKNFPDTIDTVKDEVLFATDPDQISDSALYSYHERQLLDHMNDADAKSLKETIEAREKELLETSFDRQITAKTQADFHFQTVHKFTTPYGNQRLKGTRIMTKNHYGLVTVRTDGETVMCATMTETGDGWSTKSFPARFGN